MEGKNIRFVVSGMGALAVLVLCLSFENCSPGGSGNGSLVLNTNQNAGLGSGSLPLPGASPGASPSGNCPAEDLTGATGHYKLVPGSGHSIVINATGTYGPGFPSPLPALGLGTIFTNGNALGYITTAYPFTCIANGVSRVISAQNTAGGKICDVSFDNTNSATVTGSASFTLTPDANAAHGLYDFGMLCNSGCTWTPANFQVELICGPTSP